MTLTFPRPMPQVGVASQMFEPRRVDYASPEANGRIGAVQAGFPLWTTQLTLGPMEDVDGDLWRAFIPSLRGAARLLYAADLTRPRPRAYRSGLPTGMASNAPAGGWSVSGDRETLTLTGLPAGFVLSVSDYVGFVWGDAGAGRTVARLTEAGVASSGGAVSLGITPALPTLVPAGALAHLADWMIPMRMVSGETQLAGLDGLHQLSGQFSAVQDLRA